MTSVSTPANTPSVDELVSRSSDISRYVRESATQVELTRQVSFEVISRIRQAGLFRTMQPAIYGGYEYGFDALLRIVAPIGAGCGSTGWVLSLGVVHQWLIAAFPKQAQDEYFADLDALAFGSYPPVGRVVPVDGGFRLSGVPSEGNGGQSPGPSFFLLPIADVRIDDNWFTMGLATLLGGCAKRLPVIYSTGFIREDNWDEGGWAWKNYRAAESAPVKSKRSA